MIQIVLLYVGSVIYAVIRYVAFAPDYLRHLPAFVANKGISMAAALCFAAGFLAALRTIRGGTTRVEPATWFRAGVFGAVCHIPISLAILRPSYFPEFFHAADEGAATGRLSFAGEMVFLSGGLTAATLYLLLRPRWAPRVRWWLSLAAMTTLLAHVLTMGSCRGLNLNASHAFLPPMWLISAAGVAAALGVVILSRPPAGDAPTSSSPAP